MRKTLIYSHGAIFDNKLNPPVPKTFIFRGSGIIRKTPNFPKKALPGL